MIPYSYQQDVDKAMTSISICFSFWVIMTMVLIPEFGLNDALFYSGLMTFLLSMG